jgi:hypothetical protein
VLVRRRPEGRRHTDLSVLSAAGTVGQVPNAAANYFAAPPRPPGNGSLMHARPVALAHLGSPEVVADAAQAVTGLTHGDPVCGEACAIWSVAIDRAVRSAFFEGVPEGVALPPAGGMVVGSPRRGRNRAAQVVAARRLYGRRPAGGLGGHCPDPGARRPATANLWSLLSLSSR